MIVKFSRGSGGLCLETAVPILKRGFREERFRKKPLEAKICLKCVFTIKRVNTT